MTYPTPPQPLTARIFLFGEKQDAVAALTNAMTSGDVGSTVCRQLGNLGQVGQSAAVRELSTVSAGLLELDLSYVLVAGWRKYSVLTAAARRTAETPDSEELVDIASHRVSAVHRPYVDLLVDGIHVTTVNFGLELQFDVKALIVAVRSGKLVALHSGKCNITARLGIEGFNIATREAQFELPLVIHLGNGIPLRDTQRRPADAAAKGH